MDLTERAAKYVGLMEPSVSGSNGHDRCFQAACALVQGFALDEGLALRILTDFFNPRCAPPWSERELRHKVQQAGRAASSKPMGYLVGRERADGNAQAGGRYASAPVPVDAERVKKRQEYDAGALRRMMMRGFSPDFEYLAERSPIDPRGVTPGAFLDAIFEGGEKTLVFYKFRSQGEYGHVAGDPGKTYRVAGRPGQLPVVEAAGVPLSGREGAWYLPSPLDGRWHPSGKVDEAGDPILSRRTGTSVVRWRHMLLESDNAGEAEWLNLLCQLPLPISALYTSGGKSIHALIRVEAGSKSQFDALRDRISPVLSKLGADPAAISGVRLTRLPGVLREGTVDKDGRYQKFTEPRLQRLLYLNPRPEVAALKLLPRLRDMKTP